MKVKNAKKVDLSGRLITDLKQWKVENPGALFFDSTLELNMYRFFESLGTNFVYKPEALTITPEFETIEFDYRADDLKTRRQYMREGLDKKDKSLIKRRINKGIHKELVSLKVRPSTWSVDFFLQDYGIYIEAKGFPNETFQYKLKLARSLYPQYIFLVLYTLKDFEDLKILIQNNKLPRIV